MPKTIDADDRREHVADAVFAAILDGGMAEASLRKVAQRAKLALGSVRHYFEDQAELMEFAFRVNSERIHLRALERLEELEQNPLPERPADVVDKCVAVLGALLPLDDASRADAVVHVEFMLAARTNPALAAAALDDYRATGAVVGRVVLQLLDSGLADAAADPVGEAERLIAVLDGVALRTVLQPGWASPEQGVATLTRHLGTLLAG